MKILYVTTVSNTVDAFLIPHIKFLIDQGHQVDVACNIIREPRLEFLELGCKIHNIKFQRSPIKKENYKAYNKIKELVLKENYELIHTHTPIASFLTRIACRNILNLKMLYTAHGFHFYKNAPLKNWLVYYPIEIIAARFTDGLITINEEDYAIAKKMKLRKLNSVFKVNGVGIDLNRFTSKAIEEKSNLRKKYGYSSNSFILFYAAELNHNKHQDLLINVINLLKDKIPDVKLLLAGNGNLRQEYEKQIRKLGLQDNIQLLGYRKDILNLLKMSDIAVASSRREGLPVNVMEAMATGLPLVVTNCRGQRDLVYNGQNGYIVGIDDTKGFAEAIEKLYKSRELRTEFGRKNIDLIQRYSLENVINEMERTYSQYV